MFYFKIHTCLPAWLLARLFANELLVVQLQFFVYYEISAASVPYSMP